VASDSREARSTANYEANKKLVTRYFDAMQRGAMNEATELWASEATNYASGRKGQQPARGRDAIGTVHRMLRAAFPDRRYQIDDLIAEGDQVVCRMTVSGKFGGHAAATVDADAARLGRCRGHGAGSGVGNRQALFR